MSKYDNSNRYKLLFWNQAVNQYGHTKRVAVYLDLRHAEGLVLRAANNKRQLSTAGPCIAKVNG